MENHHHSCTHCACNNPILRLLKDELFSPENFAALPKQRASVKEKQTQAFMVTGGTIRPMVNGAVDTVPAIGFADGYVVATGTEEEVYAFMQANHPGFISRELAENNTLLPGLIEPHVHLVPTAMLMGWTDLGGFTEQDLNPQYDISLITSLIQQGVAGLKKDQWFLGWGLDPALMPLQDNNKELITIDLKLLDSITTDAPVLIIAASMHTAYVNTPALSKIWHNPANKEALKDYISFDIYKDLTKGQLQQAKGMDPGMKTIPFAQKTAMFMDAFVNLKTIFETANARGVTFMHDAGMNPTLKAMLEAYLAVNESTVRIGAAQVCDTLEDAQKLTTFAIPDTYQPIYLSHVKVISDGSNQGLTGYQSDKYLCKADHKHGIYNYAEKHHPLPQHAPEDFLKLMETIIRERKWPVMIHANGDFAVQFAIEAFKVSIPRNEAPLRHRIEHCSLTTQENLDVMKTLHVSPSFLIGHVGYWGYAFKEAIFGEKSQMLDLCKSALDKGMQITFHSDNSVSPLGPLRMMEQSITRRMEADPLRGVLNAQECITNEQALTAVTYDAAWQCYAEQWTGSLKVGNFADFVVLQQDPLTMKDPFMHMRNIGVLETWMAGTLVYGSTVSEEVSMA
jgi:predicted amidohydrolase YtcJ